MRSGGPQAGPVAEACSCMAMPDADNAGKFTMLHGDDFYRRRFVCCYKYEVAGMRVTYFCWGLNSSKFFTEINAGFFVCVRKK